ncbi:SDR family NAD(P)-dependent oxidoreductase [Pseudooceanicola onchidii]|uniref:SDR family NAD(P)-dependent oxidoreductase n=1 Tax=Pseudooceanicola onchidii TaxID=2562279 RepID=UPI0010AA4EBC|nr:glucose 1-dehydrogenase [Pseudooceanicola onchidii]
MQTEDMGGVVVTGAARGIGFAIARHAAATGHGVVIADIDDAAGQKAAEAIGAEGGQARFFRVDVTDRAQVRAAIDACVAAHGHLHGIVNNAGFNRPQPFLETTEENWSQIMTVNGLGVLIGIQEAAKAMIATGTGGKIISTASMAGRAGFGDFAPYCASKAAVISLTQAAARTLAPHGITANAFAPGVVETDLWTTLDRDLMDMGASSEPGEALKTFAAGIPLGRTSTPGDIAGTVGFLLSPASDYMTGQCLQIDGGMIMQ